MEQEILERIKAQEELLQKVYISAEKTRKYFMWTLIVSVAVVILPIIGLLAVIPTFLSTMGGAYGI
ncbi:MAG: hypothetical protein HZB11_00935 [Candidatus Yonathbacteria bacterium]|nr:hypothetical protein [Candidatus Yonathbacteria bacterium]